MQLRLHPKMKYQGFSNWPPAWGGSYGRGTVFPQGEQGTLRETRIQEKSEALPRHILLAIDFMGSDHSGVLCFDDETMVDRLNAVLSKFVGKDISEIGNTDVDL